MWTVSKVDIRVSTKKQEQRNELNLPAQQQKCEGWAKRADIPVMKVSFVLVICMEN